VTRPHEVVLEPEVGEEADDHFWWVSVEDGSA
jgi:hypothetical protein